MDLKFCSSVYYIVMYKQLKLHIQPLVYQMVNIMTASEKQLKYRWW